MERNIFTFVVNDVKYGIAYKNSFISLLLFKNTEREDVLTEYEWYSFCPITVGGEEYGKMTVRHFIDFIKSSGAAGFTRSGGIMLTRVNV